MTTFIENFGFQRTFLGVIWSVYGLLYFWYLLNYCKNRKVVNHSHSLTKKGLFIFEWIYRCVLIIVIGYILLFVPIIEAKKITHIVVVILGMVSIVGGSIFLFWSRHYLGSNWTVGWSFLREGQQLITDGPYGIVRHPVYLGFILMVIGTALVMLSKNVLIAVLLIVPLVIYLKGRSEEKALLQKFGSEYENYKKKVPMLFPVKFKKEFPK